MKKYLSIFFVIFLFGNSLFADQVVFDVNHPNQMNGIKYDDFKKFPTEWRLVTVRFREDTKELRFTYANDIAWKALQNHTQPFPEGAIFGKVGVMTGPDPIFESSAVPHGNRRFQLMIKDSKKYKDENGWGYALFDAQGRASGETNIKACHACHLVAAANDYVFSQPMEMAFRELENRFKVQFVTKDVKKISDTIQKLVGTGSDKIRVFEGPMNQWVFSGTLNEIQPALIKEFIKSKIPTAFISNDQKAFVLVVSNSQKCEKENQLSIRIKETLIPLNYRVAEQERCIDAK